MLILEDPFAGLDVQSRAQIADMLGTVNSGTTKVLRDDTEDAMRLVLSLRGTGAVGMPAYVTHVARVAGGEVETLSKEEYADKLTGDKQHVVPGFNVSTNQTDKSTVPVVDAQNVSIAYGEKKVSPEIETSRSILIISSGTRRRILAHSSR
jgi:hypothetical protein